MDRVWDTSKYPPKPFVTLCKIKVNQGQELKKVIFRIFSLGGMIHVFWSEICRERKNDPRILFERHILDKN